MDGAAFAFRGGSATYKETFGSFQITDDSTPWAHTTHFGSIDDRAGDGLTIALEGDGGELGHVTLRLADAGHMTVIATAKEPSSSRARMALACDAKDHFAGLGAQTADVDQRGQRVPLFASEHGVAKANVDDDTRSDWFIRGNKHSTYAPIPAVTTSRGTAWVLDTYAYSVFDLCATDPAAVTLEAWEGELRFHLFEGPTPLEALARMTDFVGRPKMPPPWAFAPWNDALFGSDNVLKFAEWLRANHIPSSAIWSEDWRDGFFTEYGYRIKPNWRVDNTLYPSLPDLTKKLDALGIAMQVYFNPHVIEQADVFADAAQRGVLATKKSDGKPALLQGADGTFGGTR